MGKRWFSAAVVSEIAVDGVVGDDRSVDLILVRANDADAARDEALKYGRKQDVDYPNAVGDTVTWTCVDVLLVYELVDAEPTEGAEVYSCFVSAELLEDIRAQLAPKNVPDQEN